MPINVVCVAYFSARISVGTRRQLKKKGFISHVALFSFPQHFSKVWTSYWLLWSISISSTLSWAQRLSLLCLLCTGHERPHRIVLKYQKNANADLVQRKATFNNPSPEMAPRNLPRWPIAFGDSSLQSSFSSTCH